MKTLMLIALLALPSTFTYGAERIGTEETFTLPETREESCTEASKLIVSKRNKPTIEILKGSPEERYLENLIRVCANLPIHAHGKTVKTAVKTGGAVRLPDRNHVLRLDPRLIKKNRVAKNSRKYRGRTLRRLAEKYGPLEEIPWLSYCRVETADYLESIGKRHSELSEKLLVVNSAFRSTAYNEWLRKRNKNAIPVGTATGSTHGTLATIDIGYGHGLMTSDEQRLFEEQIAEDERNGLIQATKEFKQPVYHIMVYPKEFFEMASMNTKVAAMKEDDATH